MPALNVLVIAALCGCGDQSVEALSEASGGAGAAQQDGSDPSNPAGGAASPGPGKDPDLGEAVTAKAEWQRPKQEGSDNFDGLWVSGLLSTEDNGQDQPHLAPDGSGGVFVVWEEHKNNDHDQPSDIFAQHISANGSKSWGNDGIAVIDTDPTKNLPRVVADGNGGAYVVWQDVRTKPSQVRAQHLGPSGTPNYAADGLNLGGNGVPMLFPAPGGKAWAAHRSSGKITVDTLEPSGLAGSRTKNSESQKYSSTTSKG